jgi:hypothetical protein
MRKAITRLADSCDALERLQDWLERFPEAGESPEFGRRLDALEGRIGLLADELQPTEKRSVKCERSSLLRRVS